MKKHIIGISGYARSGKDTLADGLLDELTFRNRVAVKFKFANSLRRALARAFLELNLAFSVDTEITEEKDAVRPLMVEFGKFCRSRDRDIFAKAAIADIERYFRIGTDVAIVSDLRYANEGEQLRECAKTHGFGYIHIDIGRTGTFAANQEELESIEGLLDANYREDYFHGIGFNDRDVAGIHEYAALMASRIAGEEGGRK